ncbi:hypothetical protein PEDI_30680 [Persicobacter diffluens]|uniref:Uncharacterized protein n=1 Tax=Persicobacter diffluens TaxID=981 RepID=A0AAN5AML7_9BACT|nr:hypothetical protein PEDI_30680 [Persicobacter diffluens]
MDYLIYIPYIIQIKCEKITFEDGTTFWLAYAGLFILNDLYLKRQKACLKAKDRSENLIIAETVPDYIQRIASLWLRNYPKSLS